MNNHNQTPTVILTATQIHPATNRESSSNTVNTQEQPNDNTTEIDTYTLTIHISPHPNDAVYAEHIFLSSDTPNVRLSAWHPTHEPSTHYDTVFKQSKKIYTEPFTITCTAQVHTKSPTYNTHARLPHNLHVIYYQKSHAPTHAILPFEFLQDQKDTPNQIINTQQLPALAGVKQDATRHTLQQATTHRHQFSNPTLVHKIYPLMILSACVTTVIISRKRTIRWYLYILGIVATSVSALCLYLLNVAS